MLPTFLPGSLGTILGQQREAVRITLLAAARPLHDAVLEQRLYRAVKLDAGSAQRLGQIAPSERTASQRSLDARAVIVITATATLDFLALHRP